MDDRAPCAEDLHALAACVAQGDVLVLSGAGISTASGIPDYRGPESLKRARKPVQYQEYIKSAAARARYWARSMIGYPRIAEARPNRGHHALVALSERGHVRDLITQNVDGLHVRAGHPEHIELHGALREVVCMACGAVSSRAALQDELRSRNPTFAALAARTVADGDADLEDADFGAFREVPCACGGVLKPHVVFFGENVPKERVARAFAALEGARALVVLGSSLTVYSGFRFVRRANERGIPVYVVALGPTRADDICTRKIDASVGETLEALRSA